jgi:hypothetical protein
MPAAEHLFLTILWSRSHGMVKKIIRRVLFVAAAVLVLMILMLTYEIVRAIVIEAVKH